MKGQRWASRITVVALLLLTIISAAVGGAYGWLSRSLPPSTGNIALPGLAAPVPVAFDHYGIPAISAKTRNDALRALGYVSARDRLFQMDLMRRKNTGRLAEIFGKAALSSDIRARTWGLARTARDVAAKLPPAHRQQFAAYADGINAFINSTTHLPYEFSLLGYRPKSWTIEDSFVVILGMFDMLTGWSEHEERMLTVMQQCLPQDVVEFLTPDTDRYTDLLRNHAASHRPPRPIPKASLAALLSRTTSTLPAAALVDLTESRLGSNAWAIGAAKTADGRAILANDMHLGLSLPNVWYRAEIHDGNTVTTGILLPGVPIFISGSNGRIAWGATNLSGDFLDLVRLEQNPDDPSQYRTPNGWQRYESATETILIKDADPVALPVRRTIWGPVAERQLLGGSVAIRWTALDTGTHNTALLDADRANSVQSAIELFNRAGGPQLNMLLADNQGHIGWTLMGRIPRRSGFDGSVSRSWADGRIGWKGYAAATELPRQIDPPQGFLVSANDRRFDKTYPYIVGRQFGGGYRAYRATQALQGMQKIGEKQLFKLQLDEQSDFYRYYQQLALAVLSNAALAKRPELREIRDYLTAWNGRAALDTRGLPLLLRFRATLAERVFAPFLQPCRTLDSDFKYHWTFIDTPLQALLNEKPSQLLPEPGKYRHWDEFIMQQLIDSAEQLRAEYPNTALADLTWGMVNKAQIGHPFSRAYSWLGPLLDMPADELAGCTECLRVATPYFGATERLVVSPAHLSEGILHMPGGQSGHPLSPHYRDQQPFWVKGEALGLLTGKAEQRLLLHP